MKTLLCALILAVLGTTAAKADTLTINFDNPTQTATPGSTIQFFATITNNTADTIFLNSDSLTLNGLSFSINDLFFDNAPIAIAAHSTSSDVDLFDVVVSNPLADAPALYTGSYVLVGGADGGDGSAQDVLNSTTGSFAINTAGTAPSPVPEPSTIYMVLGGLSTLAPLARCARK